MNEQVIHDRPALPAGTYYITAMLIGSDKIYAQSLRLHWSQQLAPAQLALVAGANVTHFVPDDLYGAEPGMWWLFQVLIFDAWGRSATMFHQVPVSRTLDRDALAGEMAQVASEAVTSIAESLVKLLTETKPATPMTASWPSSLARH